MNGWRNHFPEVIWDDWAERGNQYAYQLRPIEPGNPASTILYGGFATKEKALEAGNAHLEQLIEEYDRKHPEQIVTRQEFKDTLLLMYTRYVWFKKSEKQRLSVSKAIDAIFAGAENYVLTGPCWTEAWEKCGLEGKPTYKALLALPIEKKGTEQDA